MVSVVVKLLDKEYEDEQSMALTRRNMNHFTHYSNLNLTLAQNWSVHFYWRWDEKLDLTFHIVESTQINVSLIRNENSIRTEEEEEGKNEILKTIKKKENWQFRIVLIKQISKLHSHKCSNGTKSEDATQRLVIFWIYNLMS